MYHPAMVGDDERRPSDASEALRRKLEELTLDIGRILHANTSTLLMVNQTLEAVAQALAPELAGRAAAPGDPPASERVAPQAEELARAVEQLLAAVTPEQREGALPEARWSELANQVAMLREYEQRIPVPEMRFSTLRILAAQVGAAIRSAAPGQLPRERTRAVLRAAADLERLTCFVDVQNTRTGVLQMDATLRALRDFITSDVRMHEVRKRLSVTALLREAVTQLKEFANASGVELEWRERGADLEVIGVERELVRALTNLLHNAIKYSWHREEGRSPWVLVHTREDDGSVLIEIENWGVPVSEEEIAHGLVFGLGYRGKWSTDRGRLGTGIGLTDAQRVAWAHDGDLILESRPASPTSLSPEDREYYRQPFLTRATLRLPRA